METANVDGLTIMFEHCTDQPYYYYHGSQPASGRSSPATSAPSTPVDLFALSPLDLAVASEDSWDLIPYDVPWGSEYYHYRAGTLPGPDGTSCIFLRSPTPLKNRRTQKACNKCRQRKAKCSGTRPVCTRCLTRGYLCEYVEDEKRVPAPTAARPRAHQQRQRSTCSSEPTECAYSTSDSESHHYVQAKSEEPEPSTSDLYYDADSNSNDSASPADYDSHWDDARFNIRASYVYDGAADYREPTASMQDYYEASSYPPVAHNPHSYHPQETSAMYQEFSDMHSHSASVHAPRPVRCTGSPSFLAPEARMSAFPVPDAQEMAQNPMLINLAAATEPASQIAIPQIPPMPAPTEPALEAPPAEYTQPQGIYYYPPADPALQYPFLQYQYAQVPMYTPGGPQDGMEHAMLYSMPTLSARMMASG